MWRERDRSKRATGLATAGFPLQAERIVCGLRYSVAAPCVIPLKHLQLNWQRISFEITRDTSRKTNVCRNWRHPLGHPHFLATLYNHDKYKASLVRCVERYRKVRLAGYKRMSRYKLLTIKENQKPSGSSQSSPASLFCLVRNLFNGQGEEHPSCVILGQLAGTIQWKMVPGNKLVSVWSRKVNTAFMILKFKSSG